MWQLLDNVSRRLESQSIPRVVDQILPSVGVGPAQDHGALQRVYVASRCPTCEVATADSGRQTLNHRFALQVPVVDVAVLEDLAERLPSACTRKLVFRVRDRDHHQPGHEPVWKLK